jgi:hypothetical protein
MTYLDPTYPSGVSTLKSTTAGPRAVDIDAMKSLDHLSQTVEDDRGLAWMMRIVGLLVVAGSLFFISRNISLNPAYDYFFAMTALIGAVTIGASWLRSPSDNWRRSREPQMEIVRMDERSQ